MEDLSQQPDDENESEFEYVDDDDAEFEDEEDGDTQLENEIDPDFDEDAFNDADDDFNDDGIDDWGDDDVDDINNDNNIMSGAKSSAFEQMIPSITSQCINSNCDEINMIPLFAAASDLKSRSRIGAMVAIRVCNLTNINPTQLEVWGITPEYPFIALRFEFGSFFLNEAKIPNVKCGMVRKLSSDEKLIQFRLSWTIEERLKNQIFTNSEWPPKDIKMKKIPNASTINDLMESSAKEYALCLEALNKYKGNEQQALSCLLDTKMAKKLSKNLPSVSSCQAQFSDIMNKISRDSMEEKSENTNSKSLSDEYKEAKDSSKIQQISEMYAMPFEAAKIAFDTLGYDEAVEQLTQNDIKQSYNEMAKNLAPTIKTKKENGFLRNLF